MERTEADLKIIIREMANYFWNEIEWERFRGEFFPSKDHKKASLNNAQAMVNFMEDMKKKYPDLAEVLSGTGA
jgi:hypothetical protein